MTHKHAVVFIRVRSFAAEQNNKRAVDAFQVEAQRSACQKIADNLGVAIIREYIEYGGTGSIGKRPVLRQMLDELLALHDAAYVITVSPDRIARQVADWAAIELEFAASGATLATTNGLQEDTAHGWPFILEGGSHG